MSVLASLAQASANERVDRNRIQNLYQAGELKAIEKHLLGLFKSKPNLSKSDSIFAYKYVSVALAADSVSQAVAKSYMYKLLALAPEVDIIDMYVSGRIYAMFSEVKREFATRSEYVQNKNSIENGSPILPIRDTLPKPIPRKNQGGNSASAKATDTANKRWLYWSLGGAVVSGALVGLYLMSNEPEQPRKITLSNEPANP